MKFKIYRAYSPICSWVEPMGWHFTQMQIRCQNQNLILWIFSHTTKKQSKRFFEKYIYNFVDSVIAGVCSETKFGLFFLLNLNKIWKTVPILVEKRKTHIERFSRCRRRLVSSKTHIHSQFWSRHQPHSTPNSNLFPSFRDNFALRIFWTTPVTVFSTKMSFSVSVRIKKFNRSCSEFQHLPIFVRFTFNIAA